MKAKLLYMVAILALAAAGLFAARMRPPDGAPADATIGATVHRTDEGFSPSDAAIKKGESVVFVNSSQEAMWPASDMHPTHGDYPEFDPREPIAPGESWTFVFEREGVWSFHDHLRSSRRGVIRVSD